MFVFAKKILVGGFVAAICFTLLGGALLVLGGPERGRAALHGMRGQVSEMIDAHIDDPVALRNQLRELEQTYPERIRSVRNDLIELEGQARQLKHEQAISERVVALADRDLAALVPQLEEARAMAEAHSSQGVRGASLVSLRFDNDVYTLKHAGNKVRQIKNARSAHASRAADAQHSLAYLEQQMGRFQEVLAELESEQVQFQAQLFDLNRQVDSIQRNDRLIAMLAERKRTLDECSRYDVVSLDQVTGQLAQVLSQQEAELDVLASPIDQSNYVDRAKHDLLESQSEASLGSDEPFVLLPIDAPRPLNPRGDHAQGGEQVFLAER